MIASPRKPERAPGDVWYQEPLVWLIILFPLSAVLGGAITVYLALRSDDGLVVDDYYKYGLQINKVLDREQTARDYGLKAIVTEEAGTLRLRLRAAPGFTMPDALRLEFLHPTRRGFDQTATVKKTAPGLFEGPAPELIPGNWHVQIGVAEWRLLEYYPVF